MLEDKHISILFETSIERIDAMPLGSFQPDPNPNLTLLNNNPTINES